MIETDEKIIEDYCDVEDYHDSENYQSLQYARGARDPEDEEE
jgi:hypothetical protein